MNPSYFAVSRRLLKERKRLATARTRVTAHVRHRKEHCEMILKASGAGAAILAGSLAFAQAPPAATSNIDELTSYQFNGQLAYRTPTGSLASLLPDAIFVGWGEGGCQSENQEPERIAVYPDGSFSLAIAPRVTTSFQLGPNGVAGPTSPPIVRWPCYRFQVEGCEAGVIPFGPQPPGAYIELKCPGRALKPSRDA